VLEIQPDELKLDRVVIRNVDSDVVRQALVEGLSSFAAKVGVRLLAEGIETSEELAAVRRLGAHIGQGYYLSRPAPLAVALARRDFSIL
ncbi:MAG: EAL domain-containing protein, partial [Actinobacteria bacterium]|nr:EAL domain-containing protein [Actinomycetota bacterium]